MDPAADTELERNTARRAHILVVDDEVALLNAYRRFFRTSHVLETAEGGAHALEILEKCSDFDLIVCDLMMPTMDGPALFDIVAERWPELSRRMVFSSGAAMSQRVQSFGARAEVQCVAKPIPRGGLERLLLQMEKLRCL